MSRPAVPILLLLVVGLAALNLYQYRTASLAPDEAIAERFTEVWATSQDTWYRNTFMGVQTLQNPFDVWVTLEILWDVKPDLLLETGTYQGGSALLWAMFLEQANPKARVLTVDVKSVAQAARRHPLAMRKVDFLIGSSTAPEIVAEVKERAEGKRVLAILDSLHHGDHVYEELKAYADVVSVGSYIIVQDGAVCGHPVDAPPCPGPYEAVERFLAEDERYVAVRDHERHMMTANPMGYLKRVR